MTGAKIKLLRERSGLTQAELARKLGVTRSSVNAWEMGVSTPTTQYVVELAVFFKVSADYLLGLSERMTVNLGDFGEEERMVIIDLINIFRRNIEKK